MLRHISEAKAAQRIADAIESVLLKGECRTADLGGKATTSQFADAIIKEIEK
jgi:isocitrate dehydrogenase (NAD+)